GRRRRRAGRDPAGSRAAGDPASHAALRRRTPGRGGGRRRRRTGWSGRPGTHSDQGERLMSFEESGARAVALEHATKSFGETRAVVDLSFAVRRGQIFGLIGPSGCGKTTTVRVAPGPPGPDRGGVLVLGREPRRFTAAMRERIGYMPQDFVLYPELSVWENLDFAASCHGVGLRGRGRRLSAMIDFVEL